MVVNQVSNNLNMASNAKFNEFKQPKFGYYIQPEQLSETNGDDKIDKKKLWIKLGIGVALLGVTSLGAVKLMPKSAAKKFDKFKQYLEKKIEEESINSKTAVFYRTVLKASVAAGEKFQGINNIISFKDIWFKRQITDKVQPIKKACDMVTNWFKNIGRFTVKKSYQSTENKFKSLNEMLKAMEQGILVRDKGEFITINGETRMAADWVKILAAKREAVGVAFRDNFSVSAVQGRYNEIEKIMEPLEDRVWAASFGDKSNFAKSDTYFTFVADKFLAVDKAKYGQKIHNIRSGISYNLSDRISAIRNLLYMNKKVLNPQDSVSEKLFRELHKQLTAINNCDINSPQFAKLQEEFLDSLSAFRKSVSMGRDKYKYDDKIISSIDEHSRIMREILASDKKGELDEILEIYEKLLPAQEFNKLKKHVLASIKSLDNSINNESVEYFDKLRDLKLGSAPTDILTILVGFGSLGVGLASTNDKDTQASVALKYGIPAIGGMLTSMVVTSMLVSGLKSHFVGFLSGLALNKIGVAVDNYRKKHNEETQVGQK